MNFVTLFLMNVASYPLGGIPKMAYKGRLRPEKGTFFRFQVHKRSWISQVEVYKRVGKPVT